MNKFAVMVYGSIALMLMTLSLFLKGEEETALARCAEFFLLLGILSCLYEIAFVGG